MQLRNNLLLLVRLCVLSFISRIFLQVALASSKGRRHERTVSGTLPPFVTTGSAGQGECNIDIDVAPCMDAEDLLPLGPGSVYEVTSPNFPKKYPHNAQ